jgi:hypothetical protein
LIPGMRFEFLAMILVLFIISFTMRYIDNLMDVSSLHKINMHAIELPQRAGAHLHLLP